MAWSSTRLWLVKLTIHFLDLQVLCQRGLAHLRGAGPQPHGRTALTYKWTSEGLVPYAPPCLQIHNLVSADAALPIDSIGGPQVPFGGLRLRADHKDNRHVSSRPVKGRRRVSSCLSWPFVMPPHGFCSPVVTL
jgi:hypothetical protein